MGADGVNLTQNDTNPVALLFSVITIRRVHGYGARLMIERLCNLFLGFASLSEYHRSLRNVLADLPPDGNIGAACLKDVVAAYGDGMATFKTFCLAIETRQTGAALALLTPSESPNPLLSPNAPLSRAVPWNDFSTYHYAAKNGDLDSAARVGRDGKRMMRKRDFARRSRLFGGHTGRPDRIGWWCFDHSPFADGQAACDALALGDRTHRLMRRHGAAEITIDSSIFPEKLYKPNALHGFAAGGEFLPNPDKTHDYGLTDGKPGPEKELVAANFPYSSVAGRIAVRYLNYLPVASASASASGP
jgi:hypothetical protein